MKGMMIFEKKGMLSPRNISLFEILRLMGEVSYEFSFPLDFLIVPYVLHVSMLHCYILDKSYKLYCDSVQLDQMLTFVEEPIAILARDIRWICSKGIPMVNVQ